MLSAESLVTQRLRVCMVALTLLQSIHVVASMKVGVGGNDSAVASAVAPGQYTVNNTDCTWAQTPSQRHHRVHTRHGRIHVHKQAGQDTSSRYNQQLPANDLKRFYQWLGGLATDRSKTQFSHGAAGARVVAKHVHVVRTSKVVTKPRGHDVLSVKDSNDKVFVLHLPRTSTAPPQWPRVHHNVLITAGIHGSEPCGPAAAAKLVDWLVSDLPAPRHVREHVSFTVVPLCNPHEFMLNKRHVHTSFKHTSTSVDPNRLFSEVNNDSMLSIRRSSQANINVTGGADGGMHQGPAHTGTLCVCSGLESATGHGGPGCTSVTKMARSRYCYVRPGACKDGQQSWAVKEAHWSVAACTPTRMTRAAALRSRVGVIKRLVSSAKWDLFLDCHRTARTRNGFFAIHSKGASAVNETTHMLRRAYHKHGFSTRWPLLSGNTTPYVMTEPGVGTSLNNSTLKDYAHIHGARMVRGASAVTPISAPVWRVAIAFYTACMSSCCTKFVGVQPEPIHTCGE